MFWLPDNRLGTVNVKPAAGSDIMVWLAPLLLAMQRFSLQHYSIIMFSLHSVSFMCYFMLKQHLFILYRWCTQHFDYTILFRLYSNNLINGSIQFDSHAITLTYILLLLTCKHWFCASWLCYLTRCLSFLRVLFTLILWFPSLLFDTVFHTVSIALRFDSGLSAL